MSDVLCWQSSNFRLTPLQNPPRRRLCISPYVRLCLEKIPSRRIVESHALEPTSAEVGQTNRQASMAEGAVASSVSVVRSATA
jgi:hypothetical protein